jgi:bacterioferritin (cytochrome b1)
MQFAQFIELMNQDLANEWTHLNFYLYHASAVTGLHAEEYKEFLTDAAKGELEHVQQFMDRLWGLEYSKPCQLGHDFPILTRVEDILNYAIELENIVATNYAKRLEQLDRLEGATPLVVAYLKVFYEAQLQDSYEDCEKMRRILADVLPASWRGRLDEIRGI